MQLVQVMSCFMIPIPVIHVRQMEDYTLPENPLAAHASRVESVNNGVDLVWTGRT